MIGGGSFRLQDFSFSVSAGPEHMFHRCCLCQHATSLQYETDSKAEVSLSAHRLMRLPVPRACSGRTVHLTCSTSNDDKLYPLLLRCIRKHVGYPTLFGTAGERHSQYL